MKKRIVIALGGNALGKTPEEQLKLVKKTAKSIVELARDGFDVIVTHGNGPQVGMINLAMETSHEEGVTPSVPFAEVGAMSQGYIGYHLQQSIQKELLKHHMRRSCIALITQVLVDKQDPAFKNPTKPIGDFYTKAQALKLTKEKGYVMKEDAGRGYRRVVASPKPVKIIESGIISDLLEDHNIVIAAGGGGIPVVEKWKSLRGVAAVIDKDLTSARLACEVKADVFLILTAVDKVYINYGKENQKGLDFMSLKEAQQYIDEKQFAEGSMLPKVEACMDFVKHRRTGQAIITSLDRALDAVLGKTGTVITRKDTKNGKK